MPNRNAGQIRDLGPCCVLWDPTPGANLDFKPTYGTVTFRSEDNAEDIFEDGHGLAPVDAVYTGRVALLEVPITRPDISALDVVLHGATKHKTGGKYKILKVPNVVGDNMFPIAMEIILKPLINNSCSGTPSEWIHIHRCYPMSMYEIGYDNAGQRVYNVTFKCFPDDSSGQVNQIWRMGPAS